MRRHQGKLLGQKRGLFGRDIPSNESGLVRSGYQLTRTHLQHVQQDPYELQNQEKVVPSPAGPRTLRHPARRPKIIQKDRKQEGQ